MSAAQGSIVVRAPIGSVYRQWLRIKDFPKFMPALKKVQELGDGHFAIVFFLKGKRQEGVLEIMLRVPERRLVWRTISDRRAPDHLAGVVSFASRPGQTTCVNLKLTSTFGGAVSHRIVKFLHNFKRLVEAGPKV